MKTILLVEDDPDTGTIYKEALVLGGYQVHLARHGAEGVHMARLYKPDLTIMDIRMPGMDGWTALSYLKSDYETSQLPIWAISAYFDQEMRPRTGFSRWLEKPVTPIQLIQMVDEFLAPPLPEFPV